MKKPTQTDQSPFEKHINHSFIMKFFSVMGLLILTGLFLFSGISTGHAAEGGTVFTGGGLQSGADTVKDELDESGVIQDGDVKSTIITIIEYFLKFIGIILVIIIIYSGFKLIFSQGEDDEVESAKKTILYAFIGVVLIVMSYTIVGFITGIADDANSNSNSNIASTNTGTGASSTSTNTGTGTSSTSTGEGNVPSGTIDQEETIQNQGENIIETISDLEDIVQGGGSAQTSDITEIQDQIAEIFTNAPQSEELTQNEQNIQNILNAIADDPTNLEPIQQLQDAVEAFLRTVAKIPEIRARIAYTYSARTVPVTVSLSGDQSYVIQKSKTIQKTLSENDYYWYAIGPNNERIELGRKMNTHFEISGKKSEYKPGRYTFYLEATLHDEAKKPVSFPGKAQFSFVAKEPETQISFTATDGRKSGLQIEYTEDENKEGILFIPKVIPKDGRKIILYQWRFDKRVFETRKEEGIRFSFAEGRNHSVTLTVIDNAGVKTKISNKVIIKKAVAYFSLKKDPYQLGEEIIFSGAKSKTTSAYIVEYLWKIVDENNALVHTSEDKEFVTAFNTPGQYTASLSIIDSEGEKDDSYVSFVIESKAPKGHFSFSAPQKGYPALREFDASKSFDYVNAPLTYSWDFDTDGVFEEENISSPIVSYTYPEARKYIATLRVKNKFGKETQVQKNITIRSTLNAEIEVSPEVSQVDTPILFTPTSNTGTAFQWNFGDGRTETSGKKEISHAFTKAGKYKQSLTVHDENNAKISVYKNIFIAEKDTLIAVQKIHINKRAVEYSEDICGTGKNGFTVLRSDKISFSGNESLNRDGSTQNIEYIWNFPENTVFKKPSVQWVFPKISNETCFEVSLQVKDIHTNKKSPPETLYFKVENSLPSLTGFFIQERKRNITPVSISLSAKANDKDGKIVKYSWWATQVGESQTKVGLHSTAENKTILIIPRTGEEGDKQQYIFHVEAEDNSGGIILSDDELGESESFETKTAVDKSPKVSLSQDKKTIKMGDTVVFTAESKNWGNQDITDEATFKWDFDGDNVFDDISSGSIVSHKYKAFGNFIPRVKVIYKGLATSKEGAVRVEKTEIFPRAAFLYKKTADTETTTIQFSSKNSVFDKTISGNALKYEWDFDTSVDSDGDGNSKNDIDSTEKNPEFLYPTDQKSAKVLLRVFDSVGGSDTVTHQVKFSEISGILGSFSPDSTKNIQRIWLGENGENGKGLHLKLDSITGKWKNIGDQEFFFNPDTEEWVKSFLNTNGETQRIAFKFDEDEQKWYDSSENEKPEGLKLIYDELTGKWINIGDSHFKKNEETNEWEKFDEEGNVIPKSKYENTSESWNDIIERLGDKINDSLRMLTSTTSTKLDLYGGEKEMTLGEKFQVFAFIKNLDASLYEGPVVFSVTTGQGTFSPETAQSVGGRASTWFTADSIGTVVITVKTPDTLSHEISETLQYEILDNE